MSEPFVNPDGWTIYVIEVEGKPTVQLRAVSPDRQRVVNRKGVMPSEVETFDPEAAWRNIQANKPN